MYQFGHKLGAESDNLATNLELSLVHVQYRMVCELLCSNCSWTKNIFANFELKWFADIKCRDVYFKSVPDIHRGPENGFVR